MYQHTMYYIYYYYFFIFIRKKKKYKKSFSSRCCCCLVGVMCVNCFFFIFFHIIQNVLVYKCSCLHNIVTNKQVQVVHVSCMCEMQVEKEFIYNLLRQKHLVSSGVVT